MRIESKIRTFGFLFRLRIFLVVGSLGFLLGLLNVVTTFHQFENDAATRDYRNQTVVLLSQRQQQQQQVSSSQQQSNYDWCSQVERARNKLTTLELRDKISYPCQDLKPAKSAIVCVLTGSVSSKKMKEIPKNLVSTSEEYIQGVMALGASLRNRIDREQTHMLLLVRSGVTLTTEERLRIESVGWTIGQVPTIGLKGRYTPQFPRYRHVYSKLSVVGLEEYQCILIVDADALVLDDLRPLLTCELVQKEPQHVLAAAMDLSGLPGDWTVFNSGVVLWKTSAQELERLYKLTKDDSFMQMFSSDQAFLNNVYPERLKNDILLNRQIANGNTTCCEHGNRVVALPFEYNVQTHVQIRKKYYWDIHRRQAKILHFTERKGWQCPERYKAFQGDDLKRALQCDMFDKHPFCNCMEGYHWWNAYANAQVMANQSLQLQQLPS